MYSCNIEFSGNKTKIKAFILNLLESKFRILNLFVLLLLIIST